MQKVNKTILVKKSYCPKCKNETWHSLVNNSYRCNICYTWEKK